jgi:exosome complex RNA-binding protein Csl4
MDNSIQFFIIYVPSQQLQSQLQTQHSVDKTNYVMDNHIIKSKSNYRQALEKTHYCSEVNIQKKSKNNNVQKHNTVYVLVYHRHKHLYLINIIAIAQV